MKIVREEEFRKGRRLLGHICTLDDGRIIYFAKRTHAQIFRSGRASISGAMTEGEAAWAIDETTLYSLRARGITIVGVRVTDTGDLYLANLKDFFDFKKAQVRDYTGIGRGGSRQRYLKLQHFAFKRGDRALAVA
jgi:hypothetical protein